MLKKAREKLSPREVSLVKLFIWAGLVVWMLFYLAFGLAVARFLVSQVPHVFYRMGPIGVEAMKWVMPIWFIATVLLTIYYMAKWANKKLRSQNGNS